MVLRDVGSGELFIYIDEDLADNDTPNSLARYRMTVTEELVHIHLHRPLIEAIQGPDDFRKLHSHPQWTEIERNAKKFAALLLMPTQPLMVEAREVYHQIAGQPQIREQLTKSIALPNAGNLTSRSGSILRWPSGSKSPRWQCTTASASGRRKSISTSSGPWSRGAIPYSDVSHGLH